MRNADTRRFFQHLLLLIVSLGAGLLTDAAYGRDESEAVVAFDIPAQPLDSALLMVSAQANVDVLVPSALVAPLQSPALKRSMTLSFIFFQIHC